MLKNLCKLGEVKEEDLERYFLLHLDVISSFALLIRNSAIEFGQEPELPL